MHQLAVAQRVVGGVVLDDARHVDHGGGRHSKRLEEPLVEEVAVATAAGMLDDHAEQRVADVAVLEALTGGEAQLVLDRGVKHFGGRVTHPCATRPQRLEAARQPRQPRRVRQQVAYRDRLPRLRRAREVPRHRVVELDLAFLDQEHDRRRRELLGHGRQLEDGVRRHRDVVLHVGETVAAHLHELAVAGDGERRAGDVAPLHLGLDVLVDRIGPRGRRGQRGEEHQKDRGE